MARYGVVRRILGQRPAAASIRGVSRTAQSRAAWIVPVLQTGWPPPGRLAAIEAPRSTLPPGVPEDPPDDAYRDHVGIHRSRRRAPATSPSPVLRSRLGAEQANGCRRLADRYGTGALRTTSMQNLVIPTFPTARAGALVRELERPTSCSMRRRSGAERWPAPAPSSCKAALTGRRASPAASSRVLEQRLPGFEPASAHQRHRLSEQLRAALDRRLGPRGQESQGRRRAGRRLLLLRGGAVAGIRRWRGPSASGYRRPRVAPAIERLLRSFLGARRPTENFRQFAARHTDDELRALLAGS